MEKLRPFLAAILGLTLWVQGFAIAAAPIAVADQATESAMEMPCHSDAVASTCDCCDGDCADMAGCVIGHFFAAAPAAPVPLAAAPHAAAAPRGWSPKTAVLSLPVRPPIVSHA